MKYGLLLMIFVCIGIASAVMNVGYDSGNPEIKLTTPTQLNNTIGTVNSSQCWQGFCTVANFGSNTVTGGTGTFGSLVLSGDINTITDPLYYGSASRVLTITGDAGLGLSGSPFITARRGDSSHNAGFSVGERGLNDFWDFGVVAGTTDFTFTNLATSQNTLILNSSDDSATFYGNVSAVYFLGNGSKLTGLPPGGWQSNNGTEKRNYTTTGNVTSDNLQIMKRLLIGSGSSDFNNNVRIVKTASLASAPWNVLSLTSTLDTGGSQSSSVINFDTSYSGTGNHNGDIQALFGLLRVSKGAGNLTGRVLGSRIVFYHGANSTISEVNMYDTVGGIENSVRGIITNYREFYARGFNSSNSNITNAYHFKTERYVKDSGTIGTAYGIYLENETAGNTNWQVYSAGGNNYFGNGNHTFVGDVNITGNMTGSIYYGEMNNFTINGYIATPPVTGVYHNITNLTSDLVNGFSIIETGTAGTKLKALYPGVYSVYGKVTWAIQNGGTYGFGVNINGVNPETGGGNEHAGDCYSQSDGLASGGKQSMSVSCFYRLNRGDNLTAVYDDQSASSKTLTIYKVELNARWLGN